MYRHIVFISFREDVDESTRKEMFHQGSQLGEACGGPKAGIMEWGMKWNLDPRKGVHMIEVAAFKNQEAFEIFRNHEFHKRFSNTLQKNADWKVADWID